MVFVKL